jgi:hypothetical protein
MAGGERRGEESGRDGRRDLGEAENAREGSPAQPDLSLARTRWRRWRRASREAGPRPFPSAPTRARPGRSGGARSPGSAAGGEGRARPGPLCKAPGAAAPWQR